MPGKPFFTIVLPTFNRALTIDLPIRSVLMQTFSDWELIIIDDGSTDNTKDNIAKYFHDKRIKYFYHENKERSASRNRGISLASGDYICFIDSDDEFMENHLEEFHHAICSSDHKTGLWFTKTYLRDNDGNISVKPVPSVKEMDILSFIMHYTFTPLNVCINKSILESLLFDEQLNLAEDMDLWLRISASGFGINEINTPTAIYNSREDMFSKNAFDYLIAYKNIFHKTELKSILPGIKKRMLLSKCHFFISLQQENKKSYGKMYFSIIKSFILFHKGYNYRTNKILLVMFLYHLPLAGKFIKLFRTITKRINDKNY